MVFVSNLVSALILAVIQGFTEWLPVSSSGHLVIFEGILGYKGGLEFDVALHFGTLMAVFVYFGKEITDIFKDFVSGKLKTDNGKLALFLIVASIPAGIVGFLLRNFYSTFSDLRVIALGFGITGLLLLIASLEFKKEDNLSYWKSFLIGIAQAIAIIPGISRSGATISSGVLLGLKEREAMKFSFLMSIPVIFGASILSIGNKTLQPELILATLVSFVVGLLTIHLMFKFVLVKRKNFRWFGAYCILLALVLWFFVFF